MNWRVVSVVVGLLTIPNASMLDAQLTQIAGVTCASPPPFHCPEAYCPRELIAQPGNGVLPKSNRAFFLDYPCDLKRDETVTFVLNLHGGGSIGNWQRHYFPIMDLQDKYRLVVATPSAVRVLWSPQDDDSHLRTIVNFVFDRFGAGRVKAFWLAGKASIRNSAGRACSCTPNARTDTSLPM